MKRNLLLPVSALIILVFGILGFSKPSTEFSHFMSTEKIPNTPEAKQIMATMNRAYQVLGTTSQSFDVSEFPNVFVDTEDYQLTDEQQKTVAEALSLSVTEVQKAGYLSAMQAKYISRGRGAKLLQAALEKARAENRELTATEFQEIVKANQGQMPSGNPITGNKTVLTFESIEINGEKAIVRYDDGAALQEAILVKQEGRWLIASIVPIWVHF
jgi:hypothetical protein